MYRRSEYEIDVSYEKWPEEDRELGEASEADWYVTTTTERLSDVPDELPGFSWDWSPTYSPDDIYPGALLDYTDTESMEALVKGIETTYHAFITRDGKPLTREAIKELGEKLGLKSPPWEKRAMTTKRVAWSEYDLENEAVISEWRGGYNLSIDGKHIGSFQFFGDALDAFNKKANEDNYYPDLFYDNGRGNISLMNYEGDIISDEEAEMKDQDILNEEFEEEERWGATKRIAFDGEDQIPSANPYDAVDRYGHTQHLFLFSFGAYAEDKVYVWAQGVERGLDNAVYWLKHKEPDNPVFVTREEYYELYNEAKEALAPEAREEEILEAAEVDLTWAGETWIDYNWYVDDVTDEETIAKVLERSEQEISSREGRTQRSADNYQEEAKEIVEKSDPRNIPDFGYHGDLPLGETWAYTISVNRDSGLLDQSNWEVIMTEMKTCFPNDVAIERASHWAVGWVDYLAVKMLDDSGAVTEAGKAIIDWQHKLENYPVADEMHWSEKEHEYAGESIDREISAILDDNEVDFTEADVENVYEWLRENTNAIDYILEDPENNSLYKYEDDVVAAARALGLTSSREAASDEPKTAQPSMDEFTEAYIKAALWSSTDDNEIPLEDNYTVDDIGSECLQMIIEDCAKFQREHNEAVEMDKVRAGIDFWLTRNGHGAGFWDGDWPEPDATELTEASEAFGESDLYIGDDGKVYCS